MVAGACITERRLSKSGVKRNNMFPAHITHEFYTFKFERDLAFERIAKR